MWYLKVLWLHDFEDEPVELLSEIGPDGYEVRKVERYRDGRLDLADETRETGTTGLGEVPIPALEDINSQQEFVATAISAAEFEDVWSRATC